MIFIRIEITLKFHIASENNISRSECIIFRVNVCTLLMLVLLCVIVVVIILLVMLMVLNNLDYRYIAYIVIYSSPFWSEHEKTSTCHQQFKTKPHAPFKRKETQSITKHFFSLLSDWQPLEYLREVIRDWHLK